MKSNKLTVAVTGLLLILTLLVGYGTKTTVHVDPVLPRYTVAELTREAGAVVVGTVQKKLGVTRMRHQNEKVDSLYTDYAFVVQESLKGPYKAGESIVLRLTGGQDGDLTTVVPQEYSFSGGERTLLFLAKQTGPTGEAYILTAHQGIFDVNADNGVATSRIAHLGSLPVDQLKADIRQAASK